MIVCGRERGPRPVAVISHRRPAALSGAEVSALLFTTLLPSASRILINVEMDDAGIIDESGSSGCDCVFRHLGLTTVLHEVASFGKLTGHGVTLIGTDVLSILEDRLPAKLGGRVGDFQLVEREAGAQTEIELRVSPACMRPPPPCAGASSTSSATSRVAPTRPRCGGTHKR
jgi:hypothetical protein